MIKLSRPDCPEELEKLKDELTQEYKDTKKQSGRENLLLFHY